MKKRLFAFILSLTLLFSSVIIPVDAENIGEFTVKVSNATAIAGDSQVAVDILLENNPGIAGFSFCVNFDTEKLVLVKTEIQIDNGYKVIAQPTGYGVNLAWTGSSKYVGDGKIATLYFNIPKEITASEADVQIVYRDGYDSFYDSSEKDISVQTVNGTVAIAALEESATPAVIVGEGEVDCGETDITVPITLSNNPGISGFSFCINYDTSRLKLTSTEILLDGYKVISYPDGYEINIAWTSTNSYKENGTIVNMNFSLTEDADAGKAYINLVFRDDYDSIYGFADGKEQDILFHTYNGYVDVSEREFGEWVITKPATCISTGLKTRTCLICSKTETAIIPKTDHEYEAVITEPTCNAKGYTTHTCKNCGEYYIDTYIDKTAHIWNEGEVTKEADCVNEGVKTYTCKKCGEKKTEPIAATGHFLDDWYVYTKAEFLTDGEERRECSKCSYYESRRISKLSESHVCSYTGTEEIISNPTCTQSGSKKIYCSETKCGKYIVVDIAATGHKYSEEWTVDMEPTITQEGSKSHHCTVCGAKTDVTKIPKLHTHTYTGEFEIIKEPNCTTEGTGKRYCSVEGCTEYVEEVIPATGHKYSEEWTIDEEPTITQEGSKSHHCTVCGAKTDVTKIPKLHTHTYTGEFEIIKEPNCTTEGTGKRYCSVEGCTEYVEEIIPAIGHDWQQWKKVQDDDSTTEMEERECSHCKEKQTRPVNRWIKEPSIENWRYGEKAKLPVGESAYGTIIYSYCDSENGTFVSEVPTKVGTWYMKAVVEATDNYGGLEKNISFSILETAPKYVVGDVNNDGSITAEDALAILKRVVGLDILTGDALTSADVNADSAITAEDALDVLKKVVGLLDHFKAEEAN